MMRRRKSRQMRRRKRRRGRISLRRIGGEGRALGHRCRGNEEVERGRVKSHWRGRRVQKTGQCCRRFPTKRQPKEDEQNDQSIPINQLPLFSSHPPYDIRLATAPIIIIKRSEFPTKMQHDDFYDKLPYTLTQDQTHPDFVIFGTGLQQCLIAAYKAKSQSKVGLIIDTQKTYGSSLKTVTFKEFHSLNTRASKQKMYDFITPSTFLQLNQQFYDWSIQNNKYRGYSIDIQPNFFFASSITCECLKQADMDKYMDFHLVNNILHIHQQQFRHVPLSKGKIFESKELSLIEKKTLLMSIHKLIKIYHRWMKLEEDINSTKEFDKGFGDIEEELYNEFQQMLDLPFVGFLEKLVKKNKKIMNYLTYIICNYQYNYEQQLPEFVQKLYTLRGFIQKFGKFIKSCGIYGEIPYLYVDNGIGDIPQAFSRIASIYGSTYILHPKVTIDAIQEVGEEIHITSNLSPDVPIKTKEVYYGPNYLDLKKTEEQFYEEKTLRVLLLCQKNGKEETSPSICFVNDIKGFVNPVYLFTFDSSTQSCPNNLIIYQFQTVISHEQQQKTENGEQFIELLTKIYGETFRANIKYFSVYIRTRRYPKQLQSFSKEYRLNDTKGIDLDQHFNNFISIIGQKQHYFKRDNKNQDEAEPFGGYETNYLLEKLDGINLKEEVKETPVEVEVNEEIKPLEEVDQEAEPQPQIEVLNEPTVLSEPTNVPSPVQPQPQKSEQQ